MPIISREELIEFPYKFLWRMFLLTKVLPNVHQHRLAPHKEEVLNCAMVANDEVIYDLLVCHIYTYQII
jgi:hypothetical protein